MSLLENITLQMSLDDRNFEKEFKDVTKMTSKQMDMLTLGAEAFEAKWEDITSNLRSVKRVASGLAVSAAIYAITDAVTGASSAILTFRNNLEASKISMEYFAQSSTQALEYIRELEDFAAYTPFSTDSAISMAQYLQAMSVPINNSKSMLKVISDTAAATGSTEENMQRIVTALGQILTKGKLAAEEVRQLANANIPIYDILKEQLNLTGQQIKNLGNLNINASRAVVAILDGLKDRYEGASEKIADTLGGMTETIKDDALIIGEAFFHGTLDRLEDRITGIRDKLDEWRDISLHYGTGGMIEAIIGDLDKSGKGDLEQLIIAAIAGFKNLGDTIHEFTTRNGTLLKTFAKTAYTGVMSLTIAADYLLRIFNTLQKAGEQVVDVINRLTGTSLTLSDVITGLLVFKTVGKTLYFAGNTALWAGKQFISLGTSLTSVIPVIGSAGAFTRGLTAGLITLTAAAATAYLGLKAIRGATGVTGDSTLVTDEYKQQMEEYNDALSQWEESLNQDYSAIADNWAASMSDALDDTQKKATKTAKKIQKTWLMSFDEVFQIREDPDDEGLDDELEKFKDIDWGQFFTLPEFRFPKRQVDQITQASHSLSDAINTAQGELSVLNFLLPGLISTAAIIGTMLKNRKDYINKVTGDGTPPPDDLLSEKELKAKLDEDIDAFKKTDDLLGKMADEYNKQTKILQDAEIELEKIRTDIADYTQQLHDAQLKVISNPSAENRSTVEQLTKLLDTAKKQKYLLEAEMPNSKLRTQYAERMEIASKVQNQRLQQINKRQALLGDMQEIHAPGGSNAAAAISANEINNNLEYTLHKLDNLTAINAERNSIIRELAAGNNTDELIRKLGSIDSRIMSISNVVDNTVKKISSGISTHISSKGSTAGIDTAKLNSIMHNNLRGIKQRVDTLTNVVSNTNIYELIDTIDNLPGQVSSIKKSLDAYLSTTREHGIITDPILINAINEQVAALETFSKPFGNLAAKVTERKQYKSVLNSDTSRRPITRQIVENLDEGIRTKLEPLAVAAQDVVKLVDENTRQVVDSLDALISLNSTLADITHRAEAQRINAVYSIANDVKNLVSDGKVYSTSQSLWYDKIREIVPKLHDDILSLANNSETKHFSDALLSEVEQVLGLSSADDSFAAFTMLDTSIDKYATETIAALQNTGAIVYDIAQNNITELRKNSTLTKEQTRLLDELESKIATNKSVVDALSISKKAYESERVMLTKFDRLSQQLNDLAAASSGNVRLLYTKLDDAIKLSTDAKSARDRINNILREPNSIKALKTGNTATTLSDLWADSNLPKLFELREQMIRIQESAKPTPNNTPSIPTKGSSILLDEIIDPLNVQLDEYIDKLAASGLTPQDVPALTAILTDLEDILEEAIETNANVSRIIAERFDIEGLNTGIPVPDVYMLRMQHIDTMDSLKSVISEIKGLGTAYDNVADSIDAMYKAGKTKIEEAAAGKFNTPSLTYYDDNALDYLRSWKDTLSNELDGRNTDMLKAAGEETDAIKLLAQKYDTRGYSNFEKETGAYKYFSFYGEQAPPNIFNGLYGGDNGIISGPIDAAHQSLHMGTTVGSMTQRGVTPQGAMSVLFGESISDEIAESFKANIQTGIAKAFNTRTRSLLSELVGNISRGDTGADATGRFAISLNGLAKLDSGTYGLVQRIAVSNSSAVKLITAMQALEMSSTALGQDIEAIGGTIASISFSEFARTMQHIDPDLTDKIASNLIAGKNLRGIFLSIVNAADKQFEKLTDRVYQFAETDTVGMSAKEIQTYAQRSVADAMLYTDMPNSAYAAHTRNIIITPDSGLEDFKKVLEENAQHILDAAKAKSLADAYLVDLDMTPSTTYGTSAGAVKRYEDISDTLKTISKSTDAFESNISRILKAANVTDDTIIRITNSLSSFDDYIYALVNNGLKTGDIRNVQATLNRLEEQIRNKTLRSFDNLFVGAEQYKFNLINSDPSEVFEAVAATVHDAQQAIKDSTPKLLATYNDMSSKILRHIDDFIKSGDTSSNKLNALLNDLSTEFNVLINTTQKLETAYGMLDHAMSARWLALRNTGDINALNVADPFRYLNKTEAVGKMFADVEDATGTSLVTILKQNGITDENDISRILNMRDAYKRIKDTVNRDYIIYPGSENLQIPYIGETTNEELLDFIDEIKSNNLEAPNIKAPNNTAGSDYVIDAVFKNLDDINDLPKMVDDLFAQTADVASTSFLARLKDGIKGIPDIFSSTIRNGGDIYSGFKNILLNIFDSANSGIGGILSGFKTNLSGFKNNVSDLWAVLKAIGYDALSLKQGQIKNTLFNPLSYLDLYTKSLPKNPTILYNSVDDFLNSTYSVDMQNLIREAVDKDKISFINNAIKNNSGTATADQIIEALYSANDIAPKLPQLNKILEYTTTGLTGKSWYDAMIDPSTIQKILNNSTEEQATTYLDMLRQTYNNLSSYGEEYLKDILSGGIEEKVFKKYGGIPDYYDEAFTAFLRGEGLEDAVGSKATNKAIRDAAKEAFGEDFKAFDDIVKAANNPDYVGGSLTHKLGVGFANAMQNPFVSTMLTPNDLFKVSGLDVVFAAKQSIDSLSAGIDEYNEQTAKWSALAGYDITALNNNGELNTTGNMITVSDAVIPGLESLVIEGAVQTILGDAAAGAATSALGLTGGAAAAVSAPITLAIAALTSGFMWATGAFDQANIASESYKQMLNNHSWVYDQVKAQGGSDEEAKKAQLKVQSSIYLEKYNKMSNLWSMNDKSAIRDLSTFTPSKFTNNNHTMNGHYSAQSLAYAINEIAGKDQNGWSHKKGNPYLTRPDGTTLAQADQLALDADKVYEQLYALYVSGGLQNIEKYNKKSFLGKFATAFNGEKLTDLEKDWRVWLDDMDDLTRARTEDLFTDVTKAAEYIAKNGEAATKNLLAQYGIVVNNIQELNEGVIWLYETALSLAEQKLAAKAEVINSGDISAVDIGTLATGSGTVNRLLDGNLSGIDQSYLDALADSTGVYITAISDTMYAMTYDIENIRDKMTGFTVTFPDKIAVGAETINVKEIASDTNAVSILNGMGININADGTVTVSTEAINANESGHFRNIDFDLSDISTFELDQLRSVGVSLFDDNGNAGVKLSELNLQNAVKGLTYNLTGVDLTNVSAAAIEALKERGISLTQDAETGRTSATISDAGYITGSKDIADLLAGLDPDIIKRMSTNLKGALEGIDAINEFGNRHGESRMGAAAGIEIDTGFMQGEYSSALEQQFAAAGIAFKVALDDEGNERVYAAINNVGESWHKAITQWRTSDITPEMRAFLDELGAEVYTSGEYTMVSTESILEKLASTNHSRLTEILFDNATMWSQFPEDVQKAFIDAGLATEDGFILLTGEMIDGWYRYQTANGMQLSKSFSAMDADTKKLFANLSSNTVIGWESLTSEQKYYLEQLGIKTEAQYNKNADELQALATNKMGIFKDGNLKSWQDLSIVQLAQLSELGIKTEEQYNANAEVLQLVATNGLALLREYTILGWSELSDTTLQNLAAMGITTEEQYKAYLDSMNVTTDTKFSLLDSTTQQKLLDLHLTTASGWGAIKEVTDTTLSETEHIALGHVKFEDLPEAIRNALAEGREGSAYEALNGAWVAINDDARTQLGEFDDTVNSMQSTLDKARDIAQQIRDIANSPEALYDTYSENLRYYRDTARNAADSGSNSWASGGGSSWEWRDGAFRDDGHKWKGWSSDISLGESFFRINPDENKVYYIYNMKVKGVDAQVVRSSEGIWKKYYGKYAYDINDESDIPSFKIGGMVTGDGIFRAGEFGMHEAIVPLEQPQAMRAVGNALAAAIPAYQLVAPLAGMLGMRDGGVASNSSFHKEEVESSVEDIVSRILDAQSHRAPQPSYNGGGDDRRPLYVGTLIADKAGLRELDRQMKRVVRQDGGR